MDEAETLLTGRLADAKKSMANCEEDLEFLREQITVCCGFGHGFFPKRSTNFLVKTMEVAVARVYNWDVVQKRKEKGDEEATEKENATVKSGG